MNYIDRLVDKIFDFEFEVDSMYESRANDRMIGGDHYHTTPVQPWDALEAWLSPEAFQAFLHGNAVKYLARAGKKGAYLEDILLRDIGFVDRTVFRFFTGFFI